MLETPWLSTSRRSVITRTSAPMAASSGVKLHFSKMAATVLRKAASDTRTWSSSGTLKRSSMLATLHGVALVALSLLPRRAIAAQGMAYHSAIYGAEAMLTPELGATASAWKSGGRYGPISGVAPGATVSAWKSGSRYGPISGRQALGATASAQGVALSFSPDLWYVVGQAGSTIPRPYPTSRMHRWRVGDDL